MAKLIWTEESLAWMQDIREYVAKTSESAAVFVLEGLIEKTQLLIDHPRLGSQLLDFIDREVREVLYGHYRIIYEFVASDNVIYVLAVIHGSMDIDRHHL